MTITQPWVVVTEGCIVSDPSGCSEHRGGLFDRKNSSTWQDQGLYDLHYERNLGTSGNGAFGYDTFSTGVPGTADIILEKQMVVGIAIKDFSSLGLWGLGAKPTNLTSLDNPYPSVMTNLKQKGMLPSISYGYTAGARYRKASPPFAQIVCLSVYVLEQKRVAGSLTLGGYDASRFLPSDVAFPFAGDPERDLVVGLQIITVRGLNTSALPLPSTNLLPEPILAFIDTGVPQIWLPSAACDAFSEMFGLQYDPTTDLYLVSDTTHKALLSQNITLEFQIAADAVSRAVVTIDFPYAAFDLTLTEDYPGINTTTQYFPIRRAANDTQYTLGRTFLQQAYIIADYERSNFSVHPCIFSENTQQDLRSILPPSNVSIPTNETHHLNGTGSSNTSSESSRSFLPGVIVAIAVGSLIAALLLSWGMFVIGRRHGNNDFQRWRIKALSHFREYFRKNKAPAKDANNGPKQYAEIEGVSVQRSELKGDLHHPSDPSADLPQPGEMSTDPSRLSYNEESENWNQESRDDGPEFELDTGTTFSYMQTPLSKIGRLEDILAKANVQK